jgi:AAA domain
VGESVWSAVVSEPAFVDFADESLPLLADEAWLLEQARNGSEPVRELRERPWRSETWETFRDTADEETKWLIDGLLPAGSFAFVAAPPKKGKTWLALDMSISLAAGVPFVSEYPIQEPQEVLYVALEGSRAALRARTGCLARGMGLDPDGDDLRRLHYLYRPRPFDLARPDSAEWLLEQQTELDAQFVVIDVLRAAARFRENVAEDFAVVRDAFEPMLAAGVTIAVLHHFGKLTDTQRDRSPGERMAGTGAMYGALDVGFLITSSESGARRLRVDIDARDFAAPEAIGLVLDGNGTGEHGGFRYTDEARFRIDESAAEERDLVGELERLFEDGEWRTLRELAAAKDVGGLGANEDVLKWTLEKHPERFVRTTGKRVGRNAQARPYGTAAMLRNLPGELLHGSGVVGVVLGESSQSTLEEELLPPKGVSSSSPESSRTTSARPGVVPADPPDRSERRYPFTNE